jgi:hypothetical protein
MGLALEMADEKIKSTALDQVKAQWRLRTSSQPVPLS